MFKNVSKSLSCILAIYSRITIKFWKKSVSNIFAIFAHVHLSFYFMHLAFMDVIILVVYGVSKWVAVALVYNSKGRWLVYA